jgi:Flp pilus assembly pilin Flp
MSGILGQLKSFWQEDEAASMVEYALLVAAVAAVGSTVFNSNDGLMQAIKDKFGAASSAIGSAN